MSKTVVLLGDVARDVVKGAHGETSFVAGGGVYYGGIALQNCSDGAFSVKVVTKCAESDKNLYWEFGKAGNQRKNIMIIISFTLFVN